MRTRQLRVARQRPATATLTRVRQGVRRRRLFATSTRARQGVPARHHIAWIIWTIQRVRTSQIVRRGAMIIPTMCRARTMRIPPAIVIRRRTRRVRHAHKISREQCSIARCILVICRVGRTLISAIKIRTIRPARRTSVAGTQTMRRASRVIRRRTRTAWMMAAATICARFIPTSRRCQKPESERGAGRARRLSRAAAIRLGALLTS